MRAIFKDDKISDVAPLFPAQWACFRAGVPPAERDGDLVSAYYRLLQDSDPAIDMKAAKDWCQWENSLFSVDPDAKPAPRRLQPAFQLAFARIVTHYHAQQLKIKALSALAEEEMNAPVRNYYLSVAHEIRGT